MTLRLQLNKNQRATLISVYAPTMMYSDEFKSRFYEELDSLIKSVPRQIMAKYGCPDKFIYMLRQLHEGAGPLSFGWTNESRPAVYRRSNIY